MPRRITSSAAERQRFVARRLVARIAELEAETRAAPHVVRLAVRMLASALSIEPHRFNGSRTMDSALNWIQVGVDRVSHAMVAARDGDAEGVERFAASSIHAAGAFAFGANEALRESVRKAPGGRLLTREELDALALMPRLPASVAREVAARCGIGVATLRRRVRAARQSRRAT